MEILWSEFFAEKFFFFIYNDTPTVMLKQEKLFQKTWVAKKRYL